MSGIYGTFHGTFVGALTLLALASGAGVALGQGDHENQLFSDSGIDGPPYQQIFLAHGELQTAHPGWATVHDYGQTPGGRTMRLVKIQNPRHVPETAGTPRPGVLISGSTHGDEYLNVEDRLAAWFLGNRESSPGVMRFLEAGGVLYVIPILNPDGYDADSRENSRGVDLNRDFDLVPTGDQNFKEIETRALAEWLDRDLAASDVKLRLTVDYHCCNGSLLFPWSYTMDNLAADTLAAHNGIAQLMLQDIDASYDYGSTGQVLGYNPRGTSKDYYFAKYDALSFTYEGSWRDEAAKFPKHTLWWDHILSRMAE